MTLVDSILSNARVVVDCRWWGSGGAGRVTEWFVRGCKDLKPQGDWLLWGPPSMEAFLWESATMKTARSSPRPFLGQRGFLEVPQGDLQLFFHQVRPLRRSPSITTIYDTIPLRWSRWKRAKRTFLAGVARQSRRILTISRFSRECLVRDLQIPSEKIDVVSFPVDDEFIERIRLLRSSMAIKPSLLFVGRFAPHKNIPGLIEAFRNTRFRKGGGRLVLVGGSPAERRAVEEVTHGDPAVDVRGIRLPAELDELYATSSAVIMPSLEEGFGLPAWEAMMCGIPVAVSDGGALPEATQGLVEPFSATSIPAMSAAIDRAIAELDSDTPRQRADHVLATAPKLAGFAEQIKKSVAQAL